MFAQKRITFCLSSISMSFSTSKKGTAAVWAGETEPFVSGAITPPIIKSVAFAYENLDDWQDVATGKATGHIYSRNTNPTVHEPKPAEAGSQSGYSQCYEVSMWSFRCNGRAALWRQSAGRTGIPVPGNKRGQPPGRSGLPDCTRHENARTAH